MKNKSHYDLLTEAAEKNNSGAWKQYPRPQMRRASYMILDDGWTMNSKPIKVPFPPQSVLSGYEGEIGEITTYETKFSIPESFSKEKILLHFGAVDQIAEVWLNDRYVGKHEGGYLGFTFDITGFINKAEEGCPVENRLVVKVTDRLSKEYPYGKQCKKRGGMWYTPVSGIWQTVWLENVPEKYIEKVVITPDTKGIKLSIKISGDTEEKIRKQAGENLITTRVELSNGQVLETGYMSGEIYINLSEYICPDGSKYVPKLWTTEEPYLYSMKIMAGSDIVETYFALRTIDIREMDGVKRVCLNGKPVFMHGVLDQGYFSDGIFTPAEPEEYERDILRMKELGFNMLRKHIKIEPECFYYYCDKHGMLVMQDMVNNGGYSFIRDTALPTIGFKKRKDTVKGVNKTHKNFIEHTRQTIEQLYNHPCIVAYTIFNEGWGQFNSDEMYDFVKSLDSTRLIDSTSGWFWQKKNDFDSEHIYFRTVEFEKRERPLFVSECGGFSRKIEGHHYSKDKSYGYGSAGDEKQLTEMITNMYRKMIIPAIPDGACGCVYTQLSDIEDEINGLYTYDRKVCKVNKEEMLKLEDEIEAALG